jgi:molecular chaperone HtpG
VDHKFQINLRGIIDLLSQHLYSGPQVYLRELLQNAVDAIRARAALEPGHQGEITIEVMQPRWLGKSATLLVADNGIGLTEPEIHQFLATIGETSKRGDLWDRPIDFLGQFGIGLLSCFVVSDEIVVITRSARDPSGRTLEWRGRANGTYTIKMVERDLAPGTQVYLTAKKGCEEYFEPERVRALAAHFGGLLPYPVRVTAGKESRLVNTEAPWRQRYASPEERTEALLEYGRKTFDTKFFDAIPLRAEPGDVDGVAFVLPYEPSLATKRTHRVYLKNMLLSEKAENLLPEWAFFVKCVVNANGLRPMASREAFYEDETLAAARAALGDCLRGYLIGLARRDPVRLQQLIALHDLSIKALAVHDDEFYRLFIHWLPFQTSLGDMTLGEFRKQQPVLRWVPTVDQFRQIARVAAAQGVGVVNGGYTYDAELLAKYDQVFPEAQVELVDPSTLLESFEELTAAERQEVAALVAAAEAVLQPFRCTPEVRKFRPQEVPTLYSTNADANFLRSVEQSKEIADTLWGSMLDNLAHKVRAGAASQLCFNYHNPLVRKLARLRDNKLLQRSVQMLYVQALLLGHHPLSAREMKLLNEGLLELIAWGADTQGRASG